MKNGLDLLQVNLVNTAFFTTLFICEIPTGAFADIFGRKHSFVMACFIVGLGDVVYGLSDGISGFIAAEMIIAIGRTFHSGAFEAWFVDSMKHHGHEGSLTKYFARESMITQVVTIVGAICGSYLYAYKIELPWLLGGIVTMIVALIAHYVIEEDYWIPKKFDFIGGLALMKNTVIKSIHYGANHVPVKIVSVIMFVQYLGSQALNMYWQPYLGENGMPVTHFGYVYSGIIGMMAVGGMIASRMITENKERKLLVWIQIVTGLIVIMMACASGLYVILGLFLLHEIPRGVMKPIISGYLQNRIPSEERATISSFCSIASHLGGVLGLILSGFAAKYFGIPITWMLSGSVFIVGALLIAKNGNNKQ